MKPWWQSVRVVVLIIGLIGCQQNTAMIRAAEMRLRLGLQYQKVKQFRAATRNLLRATELSPDDYRPKLALALLYQQLSQAKLAEQWFHKARRVQPENSRIINNYGAFLCALGQYKKAQEQFDLIRHSNQIEGQDDAVLLAGLCTLDSGQKAQAISQLMHVSAFSKPLRRRWLQHAEERVKQGRVIDAKLLLDVFRQRFGHEAQSLWLMILIAAQQGNMTQLDCYANQLALYFPHSQQYQRYKAHEY